MNFDDYIEMDDSINKPVYTRVSKYEWTKYNYDVYGDDILYYSRNYEKIILLNLIDLYNYKTY